MMTTHELLWDATPPGFTSKLTIELKCRDTTPRACGNATYYYAPILKVWRDGKPHTMMTTYLSDCDLADLPVKVVQVVASSISAIRGRFP